MEFTNILALAVATFIFVVTPGPGIIALLSRTLARGIAAGLMMGVGLMMGDFIYLIAVLASLHSIADTIAPYMIYVRIFGAMFLAYVGWQQWRAAPWIVNGQRQVNETKERTVWQTLGAGIAISGTNPKVMVFYLSFLPQFMDLSRLSLLDSVVVMVTIALSLFAGCVVYAFGADRIFRLIKNERSAVLMNRITGGSIIMVALILLLTV